MDADLRTLLREKAEDVEIDPRIPQRVRRRSRRRRVATGVLAGAVTVGAVAGAFAGVRLLLQQTAEPPQVRPAGSPVGFYPFIFPPTEEELDDTLAEVEQGSIPPSPAGTAVLFAMNVLGWRMDDVEVDVRGDDPITAIITNPTLNEDAEVTADIRTAVYLVRVPGQDDPPMYAVLASQAEDMELEPVGPDDQFGIGGTIAFRGTLRTAPPGGSVVLSVDGGPGVSVSPGPDGGFEVAAEAPDGVGPSTLLSVALVDPAGRTLALTSSRVATPIAGESEAGASEPQIALPGRVTETRDAILDAAQARDWGALRALIPERGFTFSFGGERDPIAYWQKLESEGHVPVIGDILPGVLGTEPGFDRGVFVWPAQATEDPARWDERDIEALTAIHAKEDIRSFQEIGLYVGWRVGIERDGTWVFFVSGD